MPEEPTAPKDEQQITDYKIRLAILDERPVSDSRYARKVTETVVFGAIVLFALAALFFIFTKVGLPVPSLP
jgi:hypothetical protein